MKEYLQSIFINVNTLVVQQIARHVISKQHFGGKIYFEFLAMCVQFIGQHVGDIEKLSKSWPLWQPILMLQIIMDILLLVRQYYMGIQKLSKSWPLWQTILMLQIKMEILQFIWQHYWGKAPKLRGTWRNVVKKLSNSWLLWQTIRYKYSGTVEPMGNWGTCPT